MSKFETSLVLSETALTLVKEVETYQLEVSTLKIDNPDQRSNASQLAQKMNALEKKLNDERLAQTRPIDAAKKAIMDLYNQPIAICGAVVATIRQAAGAYDAEERRKAAELQAKLQAEAEEAARKERERLAKLAEKQIDSGKVEKAEETIEKIEQVQTFVPVVTPAIQKVSGESVRKVCKFKIVDANLIPREYLEVDETKIRKVVAALKDQANIPGVEVYFEEELAFSRK